MGQAIGLTIPLKGGLDLITPEYSLAKTPGYLKEMVNFESYPGGGYRRVNGFGKWSTNTPVNSSRLFGVCQYADGIVATQLVSGSVNVYWTKDGITWYLVNSASLNGVTGVSGGVAESALAGPFTPTARGANSYVTQFILYEGNTQYGELFILSGRCALARFSTASVGGTRYYYYDEISTSTIPEVRYGTVYKDHLVVGSGYTNNDTVYWSDAFAPLSFTGGTSGYIKFSDKVTGIKTWKDRLFIFGQDSINELSGINSVPSVNTISRNIGCLQGNTIQEIGGDLIWLAPDGFRNLAGTTKIDDIELGTISKKINPIIKDIMSNFQVYTFNSCVIREKNQYRMFYTGATFTTGQQKGIVATYSMGQNGLEWEWGELQGYPLSCLSSNVVRTTSSSLNNVKELVLHGGFDGHVYVHDDITTYDFNGSSVNARILTPQVDYGDIGVKKTLHWVTINGEQSADNSGVYLQLNYDYSSSDTMQPNPYNLPFSGSTAIFGTSLYGTAKYEYPVYINKRTLVEGSGFSNSFKIYSDNTEAPYTVSGIYVRAYAGKQL